MVSEVWWRKRNVHDELSRKFVHITVGSFVAFWPFFLSWDEIKLLSLAFLAVVAVSRYLNIFQAIHSVQRPTWGELWFAIAVGAIAFTTHNKWIYAAALLQMSLADGLAAVLGVAYGRRHRYQIFGQPKSLIGSLTFFITSILILVGFSRYSGTELSALFIILTAKVQTTCLCL
jgi:phytol kinase